MSEAMLIGILAASITAATPILYAALGELIVELSGALNLGIEGIMLVGAATAVAVTAGTGIVLLGVLTAILVGAVFGLIFAAVTISVRANYIVSGLAMVLLGDGLSVFFGKPYIGIALKDFVGPLPLPLLSEIPFLGPVFFHHNLLVYVSYIAVPALWWFLYYTRQGLVLRATGEKPRTVDVVGWNVVRIRYLAIIFGGGMAGLGGAFLSVGYLHSWANEMTAGAGWIALALVIFAGWQPWKLIGGAYLFGFAYIMIFQIQLLGGVFSAISVYLMQMFPYVLAVLVLALIGLRARRRHVGYPAALGLPYVREEQT